MPPPMILPKGIVLNHDRIYNQVASYSHIPPEQVFEFWHVYTTTCRTLIDPTAQRLENFWWHVLGSDRRKLSGKTLARLFEDISKGPTFVRLRGPPNRYEGPSPPSSPVPQPAAVSSAQQTDLLETRSDALATGTEAARPYQPSSSRPPPSHPILKKPRGPSALGPRPTARFASPPESEEDESLPSDGQAAPPKGADAKVPGNFTAKEERRKTPATVPKKKAGAFVASTASKRRPAMPRRQSSQSSATAGSEGGSKDGSASSSSKGARAAAPAPEKAVKASTGKTNGVSEKPTPKPSGKRAPSRTLPGTSNSKPGNSQATAPRDEPVALEDAAATEVEQPTTGRNGKEPTRPPGIQSPKDSDSSRKEVQGPKQAGVRPLTKRTRAEIGSQGRALPHGLTSLSTATTTTVAAQGTMTDFDEASPSLASPGGLRGPLSKSSYGSPSFERSPLEPTFTPTPPSSAPSVPLARSKSQLTLLLERQNEKKPRR